MRFDPGLLYVGVMFHDIGLTERYRGSWDRFEGDGADAARDFLRGYGISEAGIELVWANDAGSTDLAHGRFGSVG